MVSWWPVCRDGLRLVQSRVARFPSAADFISSCRFTQVEAATGEPTCHATRKLRRACSSARQSGRIDNRPGGNARIGRRELVVQNRSPTATNVLLTRAALCNRAVHRRRQPYDSRKELSAITSLHAVPVLMVAGAEDTGAPTISDPSRFCQNARLAKYLRVETGGGGRRIRRRKAQAGGGFEINA